MPRRRAVTKGLALGLAALSVGCAADRPPAVPRDNILILVADDLGVDAVGAYREGAAPPPTPNIDALAARGVLFRNAWANPVCSATRSTIMTGRYSFRTGMGSARKDGTRGLSLDETTIPEAFDAAAAGFAHAAIGKWHLSEDPRAPARAGWAHYVEGPPSIVKDFYRWPRSEDGRQSIATTFLTTQLVDDALTWIDDQRGPWLCYLSFYAPHGPWMRPPDHLHSQDLRAVGPERYSPAYFKPMVEALDTEIGRLLRELGPRLEHTNVIFLGDNGTAWPVTEPPFVRQHGKGTPYEGGVNVPLIVAGPVVESPGREESALVATVDLFATTLELGGVDATAAVPPGTVLDSVSFVPYLRNPEQPPLRATVFAERFENQDWGRIATAGFATVRDSRYKLIRFFVFARDELYDLELDPWEQHDLLAANEGSSGPREPLTEEQQLAYETLSGEIDVLRSTAPPQAVSAATR